MGTRRLVVEDECLEILGMKVFMVYLKCCHYALTHSTTIVCYPFPGCHKSILDGIQTTFLKIPHHDDLDVTRVMEFAVLNTGISPIPPLV